MAEEAGAAAETAITSLIPTSGCGAIAWGSSLAVPQIPSGWRIVIAILAASLIGALLGEDTEPERARGETT